MDQLVQWMDCDTEVKNELLQSTPWITIADTERTEDSTVSSSTWYTFKTGKTNWQAIQVRPAIVSLWEAKGTDWSNRNVFYLDLSGAFIGE